MRNIPEFISDGIITLIQTNISSALDALAIDRPGGKVSLENPRTDSYFTYEHAIGYRAPAVFVVPTNVDFKLTRGPNHINATVKCFVSIIVEDKNQSLLQLKCFRYADAIAKVLTNQTIVGTQQKSVIKIMNMAFSGTEPNKGKVDSEFRKEAVILLEVEHYDLTN